MHDWILFCLVSSIIINWIDAELPDHQLNITEIFKKYGYPSEIHEVETEDGYLLTIFRLPHGRSKESSEEKNKIPVLFEHGFLGSSENFMYIGPNKSLSYLLADNGYDVWLGNARGNMHSRKHKSLNPDKDLNYWFFSFHEVGVFDIPATIDYILEKTNHSSLYYIGHSQGTTVFFVMNAERPQYNKKIKLMIALAPAASLGHLRIQILRFIARFYRMLDELALNLKLMELLPFVKNRDVQTLLKQVCGKQSIWRQICVVITKLVTGSGSEQFDESVLEFVLSTVPAGGSSRSALHYTQSINNGMFQQYDFGAKKNLKMYKSTVPPSYNFTNIAAPVALFYGRNDLIATETDVKRLATDLPNVVKIFPNRYKGFSHFDFLWAKDILELCYNEVLQLLKNHHNKE